MLKTSIIRFVRFFKFHIDEQILILFLDTFEVFDCLGLPKFRTLFDRLVVLTENTNDNVYRNKSSTSDTTIG